VGKQSLSGSGRSADPFSQYLAPRNAQNAALIDDDDDDD
jgi:hypothetical protein